MKDRSRFWALTAIEGPTQYGGNAGYEDDVSSTYRYDNQVGNHKQLGVGDFIVLKNEARALGAAIVENIDGGPATKTVRRCPDCNSTQVKPRKTRQPEWRCAVCKSEFDEPAISEVDVTEFRAHYAGSFVFFSDGPTSADLKKAALRPSDQMSIEEIDPGQVAWSSVPEFETVDALIRSCLGRNYEVPEIDSDPDDGDDQSDEFASDPDAERKRILKAISLRRGQAKFRKELLSRYARCCVVSGCSVEEALEAAHIAPYKTEAENHATNGLLLRSDIHTLFDLDLIGIEPDSMEVRLHPDLEASDYSQYFGKQLAHLRKKLARASLEMRWSKFCERLQMS